MHLILYYIIAGWANSAGTINPLKSASVDLQPMIAHSEPRNPFSDMAIFGLMDVWFKSEMLLEAIVGLLQAGICVRFHDPKGVHVHGCSDGGDCREVLARVRVRVRVRVIDEYPTILIGRCGAHLALGSAISAIVLSYWRQR